MIEITSGFTSISAGYDCCQSLAADYSRASGEPAPVRRPTGARITVDFRRLTALEPGQMLRVRYDFAGDGRQREGTGIATAPRTEVRRGHAVVYHYRVSFWIPPTALMNFIPGNVRYRTEKPESVSQARVPNLGVG